MSKNIPIQKNVYNKPYMKDVIIKKINIRLFVQMRLSTNFHLVVKYLIKF